MNFKTIRIAVVVAADGAWECSGWGYDEGDEDESEILSVLDSGAIKQDHNPNHVLWVRAKVPLPSLTSKEVSGKVEK